MAGSGFTYVSVYGKSERGHMRACIGHFQALFHHRLMWKRSNCEKKEHLIRDSRGRSKVDRRIQGLIRLADRSPASYIAQIHGCMIFMCYITCVYMYMYIYIYMYMYIYMYIYVYIYILLCIYYV